MTQISDKCLLSKTEKTQISGQTQIIWVHWSLWSGNEGFFFEKTHFLYFHLMAQMQIFGPKMQFFGPKSIFFRNHPFFLTPSWLDTKKTTFLYWPWCTEGLGVAVGAHFGPKKAKIRPGSRKTTPRAAKRPPTRKPKLSRVTSGHGGHMIPLSRVRLTLKNGSYIGVA